MVSSMISSPAAFMRAGAGVDRPFRAAKAGQAVGDGGVSHGSGLSGIGQHGGMGKKVDPQDRADRPQADA